MNVVAITPTGCRPEGIALLGEYLNAQTYDGALTWIVVDDCDPKTRIPSVRSGIDVLSIRPDWRWRPGMNTQARSLLAALEHVDDDALLIVLEDDDVYLPSHLSDALRALETHALVGERDSRYYNVLTRRSRVLRGRFHASLASTALRDDAITLLRQICSSGRETMLDVTLWKNFQGAKTLLDSHNVVGIKGLPGRPGIGVGHRSHFGSIDNSETLRHWIGDLADNYSIFARAAA